MMCLPLMPRRFRISEKVSTLSFVEIVLSALSLKAFFLDLKLYPRFFGSFFMISRSSGRRLLPARAV